MKVDIWRSTKQRGMLTRVTDYIVTLKVIFTEEERKIIELAEYGNVVLVERPQRATINEQNNDPDIWHLYVRSLLNAKNQTDEYEFRSKTESRRYQAEIVPALQRLKEALNDYQELPDHTSVEI